MSVSLGVIVPIYNTEKYIDDCINSILNQTEEFDEIILVNDGSTDSSGVICDSYLKKNSNIKLLNQENFGQAIARNKGMILAESDYICFLDSDDYLRLDYVAEIKNVLNIEAVDILYFDAKSISETNQVRLTDYYNREKIAPRDTKSGIDFFSDCYPEGYRESPCLAAYRREYLIKNEMFFPEVRIYEDNLFSFITQINALSVKYIPQKLYIRRYREQSTMTSQRTIEKWKQLVFCIESCWNYVSANVECFSSKEKDVLLRFLMESFLIIVLESRELTDYNKGKEIQEEIKLLQKKILPIVKSIDIDNMSFRTAMVLTNLNMSISRINNDLWNVLNYEKGFSKKAYETYVSELKKIMAVLPFGERKRIGIYGTGSHSERLINWYVKIFGSIRAQLYFIESYSNSEDECFMGRPIISIDDVEKYNLEEIVISSILYENEMYDKLTNGIHFQGKVYRFYEESAKDLFLDKFIGPYDIQDLKDND